MIASRIPFNDLSASVRDLVFDVARRYRIVPVAIDLNTNEGPAFYVALVHNRVVHDPFGHETQDMPFYIDSDDQQMILAAYCTSCEPPVTVLLCPVAAK